MEAAVKKILTTIAQGVLVILALAAVGWIGLSLLLTHLRITG